MTGETSKANKVRYGVHIRCWQASVGASAEHWYGRIWRRAADGSEEEEEIQFTLTADEAARLNEKDADSWLRLSGGGMKRGDRCGRYDDRARLIDDALAAIATRWDHRGRVECGQAMDCDAPLLQDDDGARCPAATA